MALDTLSSAAAESVRKTSRHALLSAFQILVRLGLVVAVGGGVRLGCGAKRSRSLTSSDAACGVAFLGEGGGGRGTWDTVTTFEGVRLACLPDDLYALLKRSRGMENVPTDVQHWAQNVLSS